MNLKIALKPQQGYNKVFDVGEYGMRLTKFGLIRLAKGTTYDGDTGETELALVLIGGNFSGEYTTNAEGEIILNALDPCYNPNLTLRKTNFALRDLLKEKPGEPGFSVLAMSDFERKATRRRGRSAGRRWAAGSSRTRPCSRRSSAWARPALQRWSGP